MTFKSRKKLPPGGQGAGHSDGRNKKGRDSEFFDHHQPEDNLTPMLKEKIMLPTHGKQKSLKRFFNEFNTGAKNRRDKHSKDASRPREFAVFFDLVDGVKVFEKSFEEEVSSELLLMSSRYKQILIGQLERHKSNLFRDWIEKVRTLDPGLQISEKNFTITGNVTKARAEELLDVSVNCALKLERISGLLGIIREYDKGGYRLKKINEIIVMASKALAEQ